MLGVCGYRSQTKYLPFHKDIARIPPATLDTCPNSLDCLFTSDSARSEAFQLCLLLYALSKQPSPLLLSHEQPQLFFCICDAPSISLSFLKACPSGPTPRLVNPFPTRTWTRVMPSLYYHKTRLSNSTSSSMQTAVLPLHIMPH